MCFDVVCKSEISRGVGGALPRIIVSVPLFMCDYYYFSCSYNWRCPAGLCCSVTVFQNEIRRLRVRAGHVISMRTPPSQLHCGQRARTCGLQGETRDSKYKAAKEAGLESKVCIHSLFRSSSVRSDLFIQTKIIR